MGESQRIVVAVGPRIYREGLAEGIERRTSIGVSDAVASVAEATELIEERGADVVLLDIGLADAARFVRHLVARHPAVRVVALAIGDNEGDVCGWASLGVAGFLTTTDSLDDLAQCIAAVGRGEFCCSPRHASMLLRRVATLSRDAGGPGTHDGLTQRQAEIVALMRARMSNKLIARHLGIELATVKNHVHQILQRLNLRSRGEVAMSGPPASCGTLHDAVMLPDPKARQRPPLNPSLVLAPRGTSHCPSEPIGTRPPAMRSLLRSVQSPYRPAGRLAPDRDP